MKQMQYRSRFPENAISRCKLVEDSEDQSEASGLPV
jgi:hypothetical protein